MKRPKLMLSIMLLTLMLIMLTSACNGDSREVVTPQEGSWRGNVFTNEQLGLRINLPDSWSVLSDADISLLRAQNDPSLGNARINLPADAYLISDTAVANLNSKASIQVLFEYVPGREHPTMDDILLQRTELLEGIGMQVNVSHAEYSFGDYLWQYIEAEITLLGTNWISRSFLNYSAGYLRSIVLTHPEGAEDIDVMLTFFDSIGSPRDIQRYSALVGEWMLEEDIWYTLTFDADGTGAIGTPSDFEHFNWQTLPGRHLLIFTDDLVESWEFTILRDSLILEDRLNPGEVFGFTGAPNFRHPAELVDTWHHEWDGERMVFREDGTGYIYFDGMTADLYWRVEGRDTLHTRLLFMAMEIDEIIHFSLDDNLLTLDFFDVYFRDGTDPPLTLSPDGFLPPHFVSDPDSIEGIWEWDIDNSYTLSFFPDGWGMRGWPGAMEMFDWYTEEDNHLIIDAFAMFEESWTYMIVDNVLTIISRQVDGLVWSYYRVE